MIPQVPARKSEEEKTKDAEPQVPAKREDESGEKTEGKIGAFPDRNAAKRRAGLVIDGIELSKVMKGELSDRLARLGIANRKTGDSVITFHCPSEAAEFSSKLWTNAPDPTEKKSRQSNNKDLSVLRNSAFRVYFSFSASQDKRTENGANSIKEANFLKDANFFKEACESYLTQHLQRELIELESEFIANGRLDDTSPGSRYSKLKREVARLIGAITDPTFVSGRAPRFMFRLTKHNTTNPKLLADELMRSGIMTSALGCESIYLVVQPFKYPLFAESAWVALIFVYPVPVPNSALNKR